MSDTPEGERDPLPADRGRRARGPATARARGGNATARSATGRSSAVRGAAVRGAAAGNAAAARDAAVEAAGTDAGNAAAARDRGPGRPAPRAEPIGRAPARHR